MGGDCWIRVVTTGYGCRACAAWLLSAVGVKRFAGQGEVGLAEGFVLSRVGVDELRDVAGQCLPVVDQLSFADLLTHPCTDHVDTHNRAVLLANQLDEALGRQDLALAVATEAVVV